MGNNIDNEDISENIDNNLENDNDIIESDKSVDKDDLVIEDNIDIENDIEKNKSDSEKQTTNYDKDDEYEEVCFLCKRTESRAGKMVHMPNNICICSDCMQKTFDSMTALGPNVFEGTINLNKDDNNDNSPFGNILGFNVMNFNDFQDMMSKKQKIKKKKNNKQENKARRTINEALIICNIF